MLLQQYGETVVPPRTGKPGRPRKPYKQWPKGAVYATVSKKYRKGRVAAVTRKLVHGTDEDLSGALETSTCSGKINTAFVERHTDSEVTILAAHFAVPTAGRIVSAGSRRRFQV